MFRSLAAVAAVAVGATLVPPAVAAPRPRVRWAGYGCTEGVAMIPVPVDRAAPLIPEPFTPLTGNGGTTVRLLLGALDCESYVVDGVRHPGGVVADAGLLAVDPKGKTVAYHLWQVSGSEALRKRMATLGMRGAYSAVGMTAPLTEVAAVSTVKGRVAWRDGGYRMVVAGANPADAALATSDWYHRSGKGLIRTRYTFSPRHTRTGASTVRTEPGSALADLLGVERSGGQGLVVHRHDITAEVFLGG